MTWTKCCCFNPYFSGCFSLSFVYSNIGFTHYSFNPYFSGCFSLRLALHAVGRYPPVFQSLFFWMLLSKLVDIPMILYSYPLCFNPYFSGCFSLRWRMCFQRCPLPKFQSLFFWMLLSKFTALYQHFTVLRVSILIFLDASL